MNVTNVEMTDSVKKILYAKKKIFINHILGIAQKDELTYYIIILFIILIKISNA